MTAWKRPEYTTQVIDNLKRCIGFEEYTLLPTIEPSGHPDVLKVFDQLYNCDMVVNDTILGCGANTLKALQRGFADTDFVIHIEDDTVPGIDSLIYLEWVNKRYKDDKDIFSATAYNNIKYPSQIPSNGYFTVYRRPWFNGWIWATWKDRFEEMAKDWNFSSWDVNINKRLRKNRYEICPSLSRSQNIGQFLGTHVRPGYWKEHHHTPIWINNIMDFADISDISNIFLKLKDKNLSYTETISPVNEPVISDADQELNQLMTTGALIGITYLALKI
jgi:hypothetical protein